MIGILYTKLSLQASTQVYPTTGVYPPKAAVSLAVFKLEMHQ